MRQVVVVGGGISGLSAARELAAAGVGDPSALRWLDPPPAAAYAQALELLTNKIRETQSNVEFLMQVQKTTLGSKDSD